MIGNINSEKKGFNYELLGIIIAICGNVLINVALNIQRLAHIRIKRIDESRDMESHDCRIPDFSDNYEYLRNGIWWLGVLLMTIGETGNFLAYGFAPASIVSPLGVFALVSNCVVNPLFFHEKLLRRNLIGVGVAVIGILFILLSSQPTGSENRQTPEELIYGAISQTSFRIYGCCTCGLACFLLYFSSWGHQKCGELSFLFSNIILVAIFGAYTALSTKAFSRMLSMEFARAFVLPVTYVLIVILLITAALQVVFLNRALKHFDTTIVIPLHFVFFTISVVIGSAIAFQEFQDKDFAHILSFVIGCFLTFVGVWLIASAQKSNNQPRRHHEQCQQDGTIRYESLDNLLPRNDPIADHDANILLSSSRPVVSRALSAVSRTQKTLLVNETTPLISDNEDNTISTPKIITAKSYPITMANSHLEANLSPGTISNISSKNSLNSYGFIKPFISTVVQTRKSLNTLRVESDSGSDNNSIDNCINNDCHISHENNSSECTESSNHITNGLVDSEL